MTSDKIPAGNYDVSDDFGIPKNATIRLEYIRCGNPDCKRCNFIGSDNQEKPMAHGPYLYAYWKENKKTKKRYIGKSWQDFNDSRTAKLVHLKPSQYKKFKVIKEEAAKGNNLARKYLELVKNEKASIEWAYKSIRDSKREQRIRKMMELAEQSNQPYDSQDQLIEFVISEMKKDGLDLANEEDIDSYISSKIT